MDVMYVSKRIGFKSAVKGFMNLVHRERSAKNELSLLGDAHR